MNSFKLIDIICITGAIQGLFLAVALQTITNKNKSANRILSILLFTIVFMLLSRTPYIRFSSPFFHKIAYCANTVMFIFAPLIYLYIRRLTFEETQKYKLSLYHYIPAIAYFIFIIWDSFYTPKELKLKNTDINKLYIIQILAILLNLYYLFKSYQLVKRYGKEEKNYLSYNQNVISFLNSFLMAKSVVILIWFMGLSNKVFSLNLPSFINYNLILVSILILAYLIGYYSLKQPDVFRIELKTDQKKTRKKLLNDTTLTQLQEALKLLMDKEKIYLNKQLTLPNLAKELNTTSNNISWLLNSVYNCSFNEYVNRNRIKDFITKIENGEHKKHTVLALAIDSGFNSKSTFNKAFKVETNNTPTNYIKNLHLN